MVVLFVSAIFNIAECQLAVTLYEVVFGFVVCALEVRQPASLA
jgi:hypothetical protein